MTIWVNRGFWGLVLFGTAPWWFAFGFTEEKGASDPRRQFDFLLGDWDVVCQYMQPDRSYKKGRVVYSAQPILDGYGVQDFWRQIDVPAPGGMAVFGSAVRVYDPKRKLWVCHWFDNQGIVSAAFTGSFQKGIGRFTFDGKDKFGEYTAHIQFYDITPNGFKWRQDNKYVGGPLIEGVLIQEYRRRTPQ